MVALFLLALIVAAGVWFRTTTFVPLVQGHRVEYFWLPNRPLSIVYWTLMLAAAFSALHVCVSRWLFQQTPDWSPRGLGYLGPIAFAGLPLLAAFNLIRGFGASLAPVTYLTIDLYPWLIAALVLACSATVAARTSAPVRSRFVARWGAVGTSMRLEWALALMLASFAWYSSPATRFDPALSGDEPKYMRYCENWFQGRGMDLDGLQTLADLPVSYSPPFWRNLTAFAAAIPGDLLDGRDDAARLGAEGTHARFNRARYLGNWFVEGKHGGVYQVHTPGISLLLLPAYTIDRYLLNWTYHYPQTPRELLATNAFAFALYLVFAILVARLLQDAGFSPAIACAASAVTALTLPIVNFPFQFYPEVAAGVLLVAIVRYVCFGDRGRVSLAALAGVAAGYLVWLHVRFLPISLVLVAGAVFTRRRHRLSASAFVAAWAVPVVLLSLYAYHVTGSLLPSAFYDARGEVLEWSSIGPGLFGFVFDRSYGALAQSPVLLVALVGVPSLLARQRRAVTLYCTVVVLVTAGMAASHDFMAAATTPGRYLVSILPFTMLGTAAAFERYGRQRTFQVAFGLLLIVSLEAAWAFNTHHLKSMSTLVDSSVSGWKFHLMFPDIHGREWRESGFHSPLLYFWITVCVAATVGPCIANRLRAWTRWRRSDWPRSRPSTPHRRPSTGVTSYGSAIAIGCVALAVTAFAVAAVPGRRFDPEYLMKPADARLAMLGASMHGNVFGAWTTDGRRVRRETIYGGTFDGFTLIPSTAAVPAGEPVGFLATPFGSGAAEFRSGAYEIDYGDGRTSGVRAMTGTIALPHEYVPGYYVATARLVSGGRAFTARSAVAVGVDSASAGGKSVIDFAAVDGFPPALASARHAKDSEVDYGDGDDTVAGRSISRIELGADRVCVNVQRDGFDASETLWIAHRSIDAWHGRGYPLAAARSPHEFEPRGWTRCVDIGADVPPYAHFAAFFLATRNATVRGPVLTTFWPTREALLGAPAYAGRFNDPFPPLRPEADHGPRQQSRR